MVTIVDPSTSQQTGDQSQKSRTQKLLDEALKRASGHPVESEEDQPVQPTQTTTILKKDDEIPFSSTAIVQALPDISNYQLVVRPEFKKLGVVRATDVRPNNTWKDDYLLQKAGIKLERIKGTKLMELCTQFTKEMRTGVSERTAGTIIVLAWQLRSTIREKLVFPDPNPVFVVSDVLLTTLSDSVIYEGGESAYPKPADVADDDFMQGVCFVATSMLRLLSKPPETYRRAYDNHIKEAYHKFYKTKFPLKGFTPSAKCIEGVSSLFSNLNVYRNTIGKLLYCHSELPNDMGMCQMLYEQHLGLTGMHAVGLFIRSCVALQANAEDLASTLWHIKNREALLTLMEILHRYVLGADEFEEIKRKTWKYARLFGNEYFMALQTKNCTGLVCTLAYLCIYAGVQGRQDIMQIAHIRTIPPESKERFKMWASRIYAFFECGAAAADGNPFANY